jgi:hypothetical protein
MIYFSTKNDLAIAIRFKSNILELWEIEHAAIQQVPAVLYTNPVSYQKAVLSAASSNGNYQSIRDQVSRDVILVERIAHQYSVNVEMDLHMPPMAGGKVFRINLLYELLHRSFSGLTNDQWTLDLMNQIIGLCENQLHKERRKLFNPLYWLMEAFTLVIRLPFILIQMSGFNVSKIEDHLFSKLFKLVEVAAILYLGIKYGMNNEQLLKLLGIAGK